MSAANEKLLEAIASDMVKSINAVLELRKSRERMKVAIDSTGNRDPLDAHNKSEYLGLIRNIRDGTAHMKNVTEATVPLAQDYMPYIDVPAVVGMTRANAETAIASAGFIDPTPDQSKPNPNVDFREDAGTPGVVLQVSPEAGTAFASSRQITIIVAIPAP